MVCICFVTLHHENQIKTNKRQDSDLKQLKLGRQDSDLKQPKLGINMLLVLFFLFFPQVHTRICLGMKCFKKINLPADLRMDCIVVKVKTSPVYTDCK